ncbi:hypothetical protein RB195_001251 [Necator americanus]|uniref:G-protein coupled receptors family 1 profile domain-containing protein n=1 Tax=Necator americanus TaxID=51031 RepID=A0ABR1DDF8_NECAM
MCWFYEDGFRTCTCILDLWIQPIICLTGVILNACCLLVFTSHRSHPLVPALIVLSICDLLQLTFTVLVLSLPAVHEYTESEQFGVLGQIAYLSTGLLSPLLLAGNFASIWTICYIAVQRYRAILRPLSSMHSPLRPFRPLIGIALAALLLNASKWAEYRWIWIEVNNNTRTVLVHQPSDLAYNETYLQVCRSHCKSKENENGLVIISGAESFMKMYSKFDHILYPVLIYLIPLLLLSVLNFRILSHISAQRVAFDHKSRLAQERRSVTLLISIVILFFVCHTGGLVIRFVDRSKYLESTVYVLFKDGINLLFNINSMANPMLYFLFTRQFRDLRVSFRHFTPSRSGSLPVTVNRGPTCKLVAQKEHEVIQHHRSTVLPAKKPLR